MHWFSQQGQPVWAVIVWLSYSCTSQSLISLIISPLLIVVGKWLACSQCVCLLFTASCHMLEQLSVLICYFRLLWCFFWQPGRSGHVVPKCFELWDSFERFCASIFGFENFSLKLNFSLLKICWNFLRPADKTAKGNSTINPVNWYSMYAHELTRLSKDLWHKAKAKKCYHGI